MNHVPRKRFGQHFLHDRGAIAKILTAIDPQPGDRLVEIGPGLGALTGPLLGRSGGLVAIEIDRDLAARLEEVYPTLTVHRGDVLDFDLGACRSHCGSSATCRTTCQRRSSSGSRQWPRGCAMPTSCCRRRWSTAWLRGRRAPRYGRLSVMLQHRFAMRKLFDVKAGAFRPPPKVDSAFVRMVPLPADALAAGRRSAVHARRDGGVHRSAGSSCGTRSPA